MCIRDSFEPEKILQKKRHKAEKNTKADRSSEGCGARRSERLQKEQHIIRAEEEQTTAARTKQDEDEEEDTGIRPPGREKNKGTKRETRQREQNKQDNKCRCYRFRVFAKIRF